MFTGIVGDVVYVIKLCFNLIVVDFVFFFVLLLGVCVVLLLWFAWVSLV